MRKKPQKGKVLREEESKYYPGPAIQKFKEEKGFEFPAGYGDNKIVLMVRDPYWVHAYWEINQKRIDEIKKELGEVFDSSKLILRIYDVTDIIFDGKNAWSYFDIPVTGGARNWYINIGKPNRSYLVDIGYLTSHGKFVVAARSNTVKVPSDKPSDVIDEEWMNPEFEKIYALSGGFGIGKGSEEIRELLARRLKEEITSPGLFSIFSPVRKIGVKPFWLTVDTELIVYGATEPTATLTVQGRPVKLREDGTFSLRFALPDGRQIIPVHATSEDGRESRTITPIVERKTE